MGQSPPTVPYAVYAREHERRVRAEQFITWEQHLFANPHLNPAQKLTLRAMRTATERGTTQDEEGRTRINLTTIGEHIGMSADTVSRSLKVFTEHVPGLVDVAERTETQENGERWTRKYVKFDEDQLLHPEQITPVVPRAHGGPRYVCQQCGSDQVTIKRRVTLVCACGHESLISETLTDQGPAPTQDAKATTPEGRMRDIPKPGSPPPLGNMRDGSVGGAADDPSEELLAAAALLLEIAGDGDDHIVMSPRGDGKYFTTHRPLTLQDTRRHLQGRTTRGALCAHDDGQTRALCWDADTTEGWDVLQDCARQLALSGYLPLLEPSPADRGGHLWIIYGDLVDATVAREHANGIAPGLKEVSEYWPGSADARHWNRVRLPGGRYLRPGIDVWCRLLSVADGEVSDDGQSAASILLTHQTPADLLAIDRRGSPAAVEDADPVVPSARADIPDRTMLPGHADEVWRATYGTEEGERLWFAFTAHDVAAWWNERHPVEELLPLEENGHGLASWRGEHTASVAARDGRWTDFGAGARRDDGSQDRGDAMELQARRNGETDRKSATLRQAARALAQEARGALEEAAVHGAPLSGWVEAIVTDAGLDHYERVAAQAGQPVDVTAMRAQLAALRGPEASDNTTTTAPAVVTDTDGKEWFVMDDDTQARTDSRHSSPLEQPSAEQDARTRSAMAEIATLDDIKAHGAATEWAALVIDGEEVIPAGRAAWLDFLWLSNNKTQQRRVYEWLVARGVAQRREAGLPGTGTASDRT